MDILYIALIIINLFLATGLGQAFSTRLGKKERLSALIIALIGIVNTIVLIYFL